MTSKRKRGRPKGSKNKKVKKITNVPKKNAFYLIDGSILRNLIDLANKLDDISEDQFKHHVADGKDDFHEWVKNVVKDSRLARQLAKSEEKNKHTIIVMRHVIRKLK